VGERDPAIRLDLFLKERIPKVSRRRIQEAIGSRVEVPGHGRPRPATLLRPGDTVIVRRAVPPEEAEPVARIPVLHVDDDLIVIDKPAGLLAHPSNKVSKGSVTHILARQIEGPLHLVHRLDRETSGVMLVARSAEAARALSAQVAREVEGIEKIYLAVVFGEMRVEGGSIDLPIGRAIRSAVYVKRGVNESEGRASRTGFHVEAAGGGFSLVRAWLHTGRRHQIRVHLAAIGHPVVGDKLYGPAESHYLRFIKSGFDERMKHELLTERQLLHAAEISIAHPRSGRRMTFAAPLPSDMREFLAAHVVEGDRFA
jgi:23S rRNA pseudouridine1911/1915/1917 synthase